MTCETCGDKPKNPAKDFTKAVIEINNPETLVLFRKVVVPTSMGDEESVPPAIGKYYNVLLVYEVNSNAYLYSSDGIPTKLTSSVAQELEERIDELSRGLQQETEDRQNADTGLNNRLVVVEGLAATAVQPADINKVVMTDVSLDSTVTSTVQINEAKVNLSTGTTSTDNVALPVASSTQAGVMNSSTYNAVSTNSNNISAILGGAVAVTGLSASPSQSDLTTAWQTETGLTTLINRASIYDVTNSKVWTYYSNDATWHAASNSTQVTVSTFTNSSEGIIKGSTSTGQVFAESDGTGSVNGWDTLSGTVSTNTNDISSIQGEIAGKLIANPVGVGSVVSTPTNVAYVDTANIVDDAVTTAKIVDEAVTAPKIDTSTLPGNTFTPVTISDTKSVGSTWTDFGTYNVATTGLYMLRLFLDSEATSTNHNSQARVMNGATEIQVLHVWPSEAWSSNYFCRNSDTWVFWLTAGDTLTLQGKQNNWTGNLTVRLNLQQIY